MAKISVWVFLCLVLFKSFEIVGMDTSQSFSVKDVLEPRLMVDRQTGNRMKKRLCVDTINLDERESLTYQPFSELLEERKKERAPLILARAETIANNVSTTNFYEAYAFLTFAFKGNFFEPIYHRYGGILHKVLDPINQQLVVGPIKFYTIARKNDAACVFIGSDYDLHKKETSSGRLKLILKAYQPGEMVKTRSNREEQTRAQIDLAKQYAHIKSKTHEVMYCLETVLLNSENRLLKEKALEQFKDAIARQSENS